MTRDKDLRRFLGTWSKFYRHYDLRGSVILKPGFYQKQSEFRSKKQLKRLTTIEFDVTCVSFYGELGQKQRNFGMCSQIDDTL